MGFVNDRMKSMGFNAKERAYYFGGLIAGAAAPIVGARYTLFIGVNADDWVGEALAWTGAVLANLSTAIIPPHAPAPVYTALVGGGLGATAAYHSRRKRHEKQRTIDDLAE